jgi:HSP20 family protein
MPVVDVYDEGDEVCRAELPVFQGKISMTLTESTLTLKGEKKKEEEIKEKNYYRSERPSEASSEASNCLKSKQTKPRLP